MEHLDDVATTFGSLHVTSTTEPSLEAPDSSEPVKFKYKDMKVGDRLCVRAHRGESVYDFYVADVNDHRRYMNDRYAFSIYCKKQPLQDVAAAEADGRCCGVKVNNVKRFERGFVVKVTEPGVIAIVRLVDMGKDMEVNFSRIRCVTSPTYTTHPAIAIHCTADEDQTWVTELPDFLYPGHQFIINIMELGNGTDIPHKVTKYLLYVVYQSHFPIP